MIKRIHIPFLCFLFLYLISCSSSGKLLDDGNKHTYNKNIQTINNYFLQISRNSSFLIDVVRNDAKNKYYTISQRQNTGKDLNRNQVGHVDITYISENKTAVEVENPDYSFGFPQYKKVDYQRIIFGRLKEMLTQK